MAVEKNLRSFIQEHFPFEFRVQTELISRRRDISLSEKQDLIIQTLKDFKIDKIVSLGPGTNRYAFKLDGFVVKVATDGEGKLDNMNEFKMTNILPPDTISRTYEVSSNGNLLVAEYVQVCPSYAEFLRHRDQAEEKLNRLNKMGLLVGDVGITDKNFTNWGLRIGTEELVMLDYAYTYDINSEQLICSKCNAHVLLNPSQDYSRLICPACKQYTLFQDLRRRIGTKEHIESIGDLTQIGYVMHKPNEMTVLDLDRSYYLRRRNHSDVKLPMFETEGPDTSEPFAIADKEAKDMAWKDIVAQDPGVSKERITLRANVATPVQLVDDDVPTGKYHGPRIIHAVESVPTPPVQKPAPFMDPIMEVDPGIFKFDDEEPKRFSTFAEALDDIERCEAEEAAKAQAEAEDDSDEGEHLDGMMEVKVLNESGYTKTEIRIGDVMFPIYGPILKAAERANVMSKPIDWSFFRHFRPTNYFITQNPEVFEGVGDCDKSIIFVKLDERKEGTLFGVYGVGDMTRITDTGGEITFNRDTRETFMKALSYAINTTIPESGTLTISRFELNVEVPDRALTDIADIEKMCDINGIKLNPPHEPEEDEESDLSSMGEDALAGLYDDSEELADEFDPDSSSYVDPDAEPEDDDDDVEVIGREAEVITPTRQSATSNPNDDVLKPVRRNN